MSEHMSEDEAAEIFVDFCTAYADCRDESLLFKPTARLSADVDTVVQAIRLSYQTGYPLPDPLESNYKSLYPQIGFFVSREDFERAQAHFVRLDSALTSVEYHPARLDYGNAMDNLSLAPGIANIQETIGGQSITGVDLFEYFDDFFEHEFLTRAPEDIDREWVKMLAKTCWFKMRSLIVDWEVFKGLVRTGDSGLEPKERALLRMKVHQKEREIDALINSLGKRNDTPD